MFLFLSFVCGFLVPVRHHDGRKCSIEKMCAQRLIAALTREHGGWEQACLRTTDARSRVQCLVPARGARRGKALDEVSAAIPRDAVARNKLLKGRNPSR
jgi:hypothetical protein